MSLDAYELRPLPRLGVQDHASRGSLRLSRLSFTLLDLFLLFLMVALGTLTAFSLLLTTETRPVSAATRPAMHAQGPAFTRPVINTPARPFDPKPQLPATKRGASRANTNVTPVEGLGNVGFYDYFNAVSPTKHVNLKVNVSSGNLLVQTSDLSLRGTGIDLSISSTYNPLSNRFTQHGNGWTFNFGSDVALQSNSDGSMTFFDPTGHDWNYQSNGSGGFKNPAGLDADLKVGSNGTHTLLFYKTNEVYAFNAANILVKDTDKNGNATTYNTNASNASQVDSITDTQGRTTTVSRDTQGRVIAITDPIGRSIQYGYNSLGQLITITDQNGQTTTFDYLNGSLVGITDPFSNTAGVAYNSNGQVGAITDQLGNETTFTYYGSSASQCSGVQPSGSNPTLNPCTVVTDANSHTTTYGYDTNFKILKVQDAAGNMTAKSYSTDNNVQQYTDGLQDLSVFSFSPDSSGHFNLNSVTDGNNSTTNFGYTDPKNPNFATTLKDSQNLQASVTYDAKGNVTSTKDTTASGGTGITTGAYVYNTNGTIASEKDGKGNQTSFTYDSKGNLAKVIFAAPLQPQHMVVDGVSRVTSLTDGNNKTTSYTYDALDQLLKVTYTDNTSVSYTYDADGNMRSLTDHTGTTTFNYDQDNRQIIKTLPNGTMISTSFDAVGNLTSLSTVGGTTTYGYNAVNLLISLTEPNGAITSFAYDAAYHRTQTTYPNGVTLKTSYDKAGQILSVIGTHGSTVLTSYTYVYTTNNLRQQVTDQTNSKTTYSYDSLSRLTSANIFTSVGTHESSFNYAYDAAGNRTSLTQGTTNPSTITYTYNAANELTNRTGATPQGGGINYTYDNNGNMTGATSGPPITYNASNQMTSFGSTTFSYTGPSQNERVQVDNTTFVYSGLGCDCESNSAGNTFYTHDNRGQLIDERTPTGTYYYLFDGLGSVVGLTDSTGALVGNETYHYDPYGLLIRQPHSAPLQVNPWRFASGFYDVSTGLYKFGIRYYDPNVGRWTQRDPVGGSLAEMVKANPYVYANNDPVNLVDPSGKNDCFGTILWTAPTAWLFIQQIDLMAGGMAEAGMSLVMEGAATADTIMVAGGLIALFAAFILVIGGDGVVIGAFIYTVRQACGL